ncbi:arrestin domain-containing protein 2 [Drosophila grimshawi]|uniref:GH18620 n=1 Tax=Drosophila grimshawi TaxID=7222 RepID=B4JHJ1_DROGR|nr:arrestin domain-containing protein 2 [Drosophila grimshawi]EDV92818.1 GH18620 [Drosophila grimshawi]
MSQFCDIQLERPSGVYHAGETVNGYINLTLTDRALIKAISLESNGYACSNWLKPQKQKKQRANNKPQVLKPMIAYGQRVDYFAKVDYFVGSEEALPQLMAAGTYCYNFSVQLPANCPSSYEAEHGHIRYTLQLMLRRSSDLPPEPAQICQIHVQQRWDPNQEANSGQAPCEVTALEQTPSLKFWQRALHLQLDIPRSSYELGAGISVHAELHNPQQLPLQSIIYKLNLVSTYVGHQLDKPKRVDSQVVRRNLISSSHQLQSLPRHGLLHFQHLHTLHVPHTPPTMGAAVCGCLQLSYEVEVVVQTKSSARFIAAQIPVIISQVTSSHAGPQKARSMCDLQAVGVSTAPSAPSAPSASNETPETTAFSSTAPNLCASMCCLVSNFREAEFMKASNVNKKDKHSISGEQLDFRPRYLYYEMEHAETERVL